MRDGPKGSGIGFRLKADRDPVIPTTDFPSQAITPEAQSPSNLDFKDEAQAIRSMALQLAGRDRRLVMNDNSKLWSVWNSHRRTCSACSPGHMAHIVGKGQPDSSMFCKEGWVRYNEFSLHCRAMKAAGL